MILCENCPTSSSPLELLENRSRNMAALHSLELALEDIKVYTKHFFEERSNILMDIEQLLNQVLQFLVKFYPKSNSANNRLLTNLDLLFKSLCFVHGFYLYPANKNCETEFNIRGRLFLYYLFISVITVGHVAQF